MFHRSYTLYCSNLFSSRTLHKFSEKVLTFERLKFIAPAKLVAFGRRMDKEDFVFKMAFNKPVPVVSVLCYL
jgi:hypothetical protein